MDCDSDFCNATPELVTGGNSLEDVLRSKLSGCCMMWLQDWCGFGDACDAEFNVSAGARNASSKEGGSREHSHVQVSQLSMAAFGFWDI